MKHYFRIKKNIDDGVHEDLKGGRESPRIEYFYQIDSFKKLKELA